MNRLFIFILLFFSAFPVLAGSTKVTVRSSSTTGESISMSDLSVVPTKRILQKELKPGEVFEQEMDITAGQYYMCIFRHTFYHIFIEPGKALEIELLPEGKMVLKGAHADLNNLMVKIARNDSLKEKYFKQLKTGKVLLDRQRFDDYQNQYDAHLQLLKEAKLSGQERKLAMGGIQGLFLEYIYKPVIDSKVFGKSNKTEITDDYASSLVNLQIIPEIVYYPGWGESLREWMYAQMKAGKLKLSDPDLWIAEWGKYLRNDLLRDNFINHLLNREMVMKYFDSRVKERFETARQLVKDPEIAKDIDRNIAKIKADTECPDVSECTFENIKGEKVALGDFKGKYVFIDFWGTGCSPCIAEMPYFHALEQKLEGQQIAFIAIALQRDNTPWIYFLKEHQLSDKENQFVMHDVNKNPIWDKIGLSGIPRFVLVGPDSKVVIKHCYRPSNPVLEMQLKAKMN